MNKPGKIVERSGIYEATKTGQQAALSKGDRFPPTTAGATWRLKVATKTTSKK
jgi:hypothetical protein